MFLQLKNNNESKSIHDSQKEKSGDEISEIYNSAHSSKACDYIVNIYYVIKNYG